MLAPNPVYAYASGGQGGCSTPGFNASETGYAGNFTAVSNNTSIATVSPSTSTGPFTVTGTGTFGQSTTITVSDTLGNHATETVDLSAICLP